jgi:hypothetical protein
MGNAMRKYALKLSILAYCVWQSADLLVAWSSNSPERIGWLAFCVWLLPVLPLKRFASSRGDSPQNMFLGGAVLLTFLGQLTWLNCLQHLGLALAIVGWKQPIVGQRLWLISIAFWMPAVGWLTSGTLGGFEAVARVILLGALVAWLVLLNGPRREPGRLHVWRAVLPLLILLCVFTRAHADPFVYSPVQSPARPFGLDIVDQVALAASDTESSDFQTNTLPLMAPLIDENLATYDPGSDFVALRPDALALAVAADVRVYFVEEQTGYHNSLGFNTGGGGIDTGNPLLIFPDATHPRNNNRRRRAPLLPGDFVAMGQFDGGTHLDFFLVSDGARGGTDVFSTQSDLNPDGIEQVVAFAQVQSPYLLLGFEDRLRPRRYDLNDVLTAVYLGEENVQWLIDNAPLNGVPAPEPASIWIVVAGATVWLCRARRKRGVATRKRDSGGDRLASIRSGGGLGCDKR